MKNVENREHKSEIEGREGNLDAVVQKNCEDPIFRAFFYKEIARAGNLSMMLHVASHDGMIQYYNKEKKLGKAKAREFLRTHYENTGDTILGLHKQIRTHKKNNHTERPENENGEHKQNGYSDTQTFMRAKTL